MHTLKSLVPIDKFCSHANLCNFWVIHASSLFKDSGFYQFFCSHFPNHQNVHFFIPEVA